MGAILLTAQCGGSEKGAGTTTNAATTAVGGSGSTETGSTTDGSATTQDESTDVLESDTFSFEYPSDWNVLQLTEIEPAPLESGLVGPGNDTDAVTMYVFKERGFDTAQEARGHVPSLRREIRAGGGRIVEGPLVFRGPNDFTAFYVSFRDREDVMHQISLMYLRGRIYRFTCEFLFEHGPDMDAGCKHALETLEIDGLEDVPQ